MLSLAAGELAPDFSLPDHTGQVRRLSDWRGQWVLLYFYPKDDTPGCTTEACSLRDHWAELQQQGVVVLGISADSVKSHAKFAKKYQLPFILLADEDKAVVQLYQVWGEKTFLGKHFLGIRRESFLINPAGQIAEHYPKVKPADHAKTVLVDLQRLQ